MKNKRPPVSLRTEKMLTILGIFFIITGILQLVIPVAAGNYAHFAWFSNHVIIILGIGILLRNRFLVTAEMCIALISETIWSVDFLGRLFLNTHIFGVTRYMFDQQFDFVIGLNLQHLLIVPLGLTALWYLKMDESGWKGSLIHAFILWIVGLLAGNQYNINCVFRSCVPYFETVKNYMLLWPVFGIVTIFASYYLLRFFNFIEKEMGPT